MANIIKLKNSARKAQVSVELTIIISVALIMFLFLFKTASDKSQQFQIFTTDQYANEILNLFTHDFNSLYLSGDGTTQVVFLPETLANNIDYSINFFPDYQLIEINYSDFGFRKTHSAFLITSRIQTNLTNIHDPITLENQNGKIIIR
ncbi:hypothetical protein J4418_03975 [Candidatus Woesearchaeota archaeon]|nr:hypothetical protein [Candidatus Woesearchaeota archaeon]